MFNSVWMSEAERMITVIPAHKCQSQHDRGRDAAQRGSRAGRRAVVCAAPACFISYSPEGKELYLSETTRAFSERDDAGKFTFYFKCFRLELTSILTSRFATGGELQLCHAGLLQDVPVQKIRPVLTINILNITEISPWRLS